MKIRCPDGSEKTVDECLECSECFPKPVMRMLLKRANRTRKKTEKPRYGVTKLVGNCLRKSFYDYTEEVVFPLDKMWIFNRGHAIHEFIQKEIPDEETEIFRELKFPAFRVIGFIDAVHNDSLYEFKTTANLPENPQESHVLQAQAYYSMLSPEQRAKAKKILIIYFSMHNIRVFEVAPRDVSSFLEARGTILTNALKTGDPPKREESYLCDYCEFRDICYGHKPANNNQQKTPKLASE